MNVKSLAKVLAGIFIALVIITGCTEVKDVEKVIPTTEEESMQETETPSATHTTAESHATPEGIVTGKSETPEPEPSVVETETAVITSGGGGSSPISTPVPTPDRGTGTGVFQLLISDKPADISDFQKLEVTFSKARIFKAESYGYGYGGEGYSTVDLNGATVDLTELVGEYAMPILEIDLEEGIYTKIELYVEKTEGILWDGYGYGYPQGAEADVKVPSGNLKIVKPFEVVSGKETKFVFDINVVKKGNKNEYNLNPVISKSGVVGKDLKEGEVKIIEK